MMLTFIVGFAGLILGMTTMFVMVEVKRREYKSNREWVERHKREVQAGEFKLRQEEAALEEERADWNAQCQKEKLAAESALLRDRRQLELEQRELAARVVSFSELDAENNLLKKDLLNIDVSMRKLQLDQTLQAES